MTLAGSVEDLLKLFNSGSQFLDYRAVLNCIKSKLLFTLFGALKTSSFIQQIFHLLSNEQHGGKAKEQMESVSTHPFPRCCIHVPCSSMTHR